MLEFQNVSFSYAQADKEGTIRNINLTIQAGEAVLLCGESGCGKTTLTCLINGLIPHYYEGELSGRVLLNGQDIFKMQLYKLAEKVGSVFQNPRSQFFTTDTTSELAFGPENLGMQKEEIQCRIRQVTDDFELSNLLWRNIFNLSGGADQRS